MDEDEDSNDLTLQNNNLLNYKGYFVENEDEDTDPKYFEFGAHFPYRKLYKRLEELSKNQNKEMMKQVNIKNIANKERNNTRNKQNNMQNLFNKYDSRGKSRNNNINNVYLKNDLTDIIIEQNSSLLKKDEQKNCKSISVNKDLHKNKKLEMKNTYQQIKNIKSKNNMNLNLVKSYEKNHLSKIKNISAVDVSTLSYSKKNLSSNLKPKKIKNNRIEISGGGGSYNQGLQKNQKIFKKNYNNGKNFNYIFSKLTKNSYNKNKYNLNNSENKCSVKNDKIKLNNKLSTPMKYYIKKNEKLNFSNISNKLIKKIPTNYIQYLSHKFTVVKNVKKQNNTKNNTKKNIIATEISLLNDSASLDKNKKYFSNNNTFDSQKNFTMNCISKSHLANYEINQKNCNHCYDYFKVRNEKNSRNHNNFNLNNMISIINSTGNNYINKTKNTINQMNLTQFNQNKTVKYNKSLNMHRNFNERKNKPLINKMNKSKNNKNNKNNSLSFIMIKSKKIAAANKNIDNKILKYISDKSNVSNKKNEKPNINISININNSNKIIYNKVVKGLNNIKPLKSISPFNNNSINACMKKNRFKINKTKEDSKIKFINIQFPKAKLLNINKK